MTTDTNAIPPKVAAAICAVMADVPKLQKGETNSHGKYNFASIDDFLEAVRPLCAKHGLIILQDEEGYESEGGWLTMRFAFTLAHSSGETWSHKVKRSIMVNAKMGSQAFGAGQSYALKQFMRSAFQIATGEAGNDVDAHAASKLPSTKPEWRGPLQKVQLKGEMKALSERMASESIATTGDLDEIVVEYRNVIDQAKHDLPDWHEGYASKHKELSMRLPVGPARSGSADQTEAPF